MISLSFPAIPEEQGENLPCEGVVLAVSNYLDQERLFITEIAKSMGMIAQEIFAKKAKAGAEKSTHLVCFGTEGKLLDTWD